MPASEPQTESMAELLISEEARQDIISIWAYVAADNVVAADRLLRAIEEKANRLRDHPLLGLDRSDIRPNVRCLTQGHYLIFYRFDPVDDRVDVVRVLHGMRDLPDAL